MARGLERQPGNSHETFVKGERAGRRGLLGALGVVLCVHFTTVEGRVYRALRKLKDSVAPQP